MHYELYISPSALKELKKLDPNERDSIKTKLKLLALDPFNTSIDITELDDVIEKLPPESMEALKLVMDEGGWVKFNKLST